MLEDIIEIQTETQGEVMVGTLQGKIHVGFYHEAMELSGEEALSLISALAMSVQNLRGK